jgi:hypothetical protein
MLSLSGVFNTIQTWLFPELREEVGELTEQQKEFVRVVEALELPRHAQLYDKCSDEPGRPQKDRLAILKSFIYKSIHKLPTTKALISIVRSSASARRLCGWETVSEIPSESTFSRAFAEFAKTNLLDEIHGVFVKEHAEGRIAQNLSRDSTAIQGREKPVAKPKKAKKAKSKAEKKQAKRMKGQATAKELTVIERQLDKTFAENLAALPTACDWGGKRNSSGNTIIWDGYKLHIDTIDGDIPVSALLTSASVHDSQAAIPLAQKSQARVINFYDLMDSAYDAKPIKEFSARINHVPVIDHNPRRGEKVDFDPAKAERYKARSGAERVNSTAKDNYGANNVRVRGHAKVFCHLMFGILTVTVNQFHRLLT